MKRSVLRLVCAVLFALGGVRLTLAHGYLVRAIPEDRAVLERSPARLQYWFSEGLETDFSSLTVHNAEGETIAEGSVSEQNDSLLTASLPARLPDGAYIVDLRLAFASDGHVIAESRVFFVGEEVAGVMGSVVNNQANPLEVVWRAITLSATVLLFGLFTLYSGVLIPAWGNPVYRAGLLPPRAMRRLTIIAISALVVAFLGNLLGLLQQSMSFFSLDAGQVISQNLWSVVRASTRFGELWTARVILLGLVGLLIGLSLYFRAEQPETVRPFWMASSWVMALCLGTFSAGSHAAGSWLWPWVGIFVDWLHIVAVGLWTGGLGALILILPVALAPYSGDEWRLALLAALRRFSRLAAGCVAVVVATGLYSALNWITSPSDMTDTAFGGSLLLKGILVVGLLVLGLAHHMALRPERFQFWKAILSRVNAFIPTLRMEALFALAVLASAGLLSATPIPVPDFAKTSIQPPSKTTYVSDLSVTQTITPGGPGVNTYDTLVTQAGQPADDLNVSVQIVNPARDWRGDWEQAEQVDDGLYVTADAEIDREGQWWTLVDIQSADGTLRRAALDWQITNAAAIVQSRPPGILNVVALGAVLLAAIWAICPHIRRFYNLLDLSPTTTTISLAALLGTAFLIALSFIYLQNTQAQYEATLYPPPEVVNTVLPDGDSLERGRELFRTSCTAWQGNDFSLFTRRLPRIRDDDLFALTRDGGQGLPPCDSTMGDVARWDLVNFIRTLKA